MKDVILILPECGRDERLLRVLRESGIHVKKTLHTAEELAQHFSGNTNGSGDGERILFAAALDDSELNLEWLRMSQVLRRSPHLLDGCIGAVITDGCSDLFTKTAGRHIVQTANAAGCLFPGRPLVEGTGSLQNFRVTARNLRADQGLREEEPSEEELYEAYVWSVRDLLNRLQHFAPPCSPSPQILVLHASVKETSNTLNLWNLVREQLDPRIRVREISLQNGTIHDCIGCPYTMCMHFSKYGSCYYGGVIAEQVLPAIDESDALMMLCPNYNDALSANLSALVNRLTSLYRRRQYLDKYLYALVVSGYSGGDIIERQLISGLNMNKTLILPPRFSLAETANDPGSILRVPGIREKSSAFARQISGQLLG